ncbi:MAG: hypothetical protein WA185_06970 [Candidatus Acidiferrales bacterium]
MPDEPKKTSDLQAAQPAIPGVPVRAAAKPATSAAKPAPAAPAQQSVAKKEAKGQPPYYLWAAGGGAILVLVIALAWWAHGVPRAAHLAPEAAAPAPAARPAPPKPVETIAVAPGPVATTSEMEEPWSTRKFLYRGADGNTTPALLVHLPGDAYWAISLREPYGTCELEFASVDKLRTDYNLAANHPMIGDPCTHTVYDLTHYGSGPNGLVRGAVVAGIGLRPPLAIEVQVEGREIVASRSE